ncbi:MAG: hypothetical protein J6P96_00225, partial [Bacteroidaceae bacterium]|nr:hypothetical protein [Bacteroidaceae bacterium]
TAGYAIASTQYTITERNPIAQANPSAGAPLSLTKIGSTYTIEGSDVSMKVNTSNGITHWNMGGVDVIPANTSGKSAPAYSNYRWIENDAPYGTDPYYSTSNGVSSRKYTVKLANDSSTVTITETGTGSLCNYKFVYTVNRDGTVDMQATYTPTGSNLRRIGMLMEFNPELSMTKYYARGPLDNTIDRKQGSDLGIYDLPVSAFHVDYVRPQTSGDRQDLRWIVLHNEAGEGISVETEGQVNLTLDNYTDEHKHQYLHQWNMDASESVFANFDYAQLGIGNASCGAGVLEKYKLPTSGSYSYKLRFAHVKDVHTAIEDIPVDAPTDGFAPIYNVRGQIVGNTSYTKSLPKGIYISGGKKFIVR